MGCIAWEESPSNTLWPYLFCGWNLLAGVPGRKETGPVANRRVSMRKIKEMLRLHFDMGLS